MAPKRRAAWPSQRHQECDGTQAQDAKAVANREEDERRGVLECDFGREKARAPDDDEVPGERGIGPARREGSGRRNEGQAEIIGRPPYPRCFG